jgi:hypothetical protein
MTSFNSDVVILVNPRIQQSPNNNDPHDIHDSDNDDVGNDSDNDDVGNDITDTYCLLQQLRQELDERFNNVSNHQQHHIDILAKMTTAMHTLTTSMQSMQSMQSSLSQSMQSMQSSLLQSFRQSCCLSCCRSKVT